MTSIVGLLFKMQFNCQMFFFSIDLTQFVCTHMLCLYSLGTIKLSIFFLSLTSFQYSNGIGVEVVVKIGVVERVRKGSILIRAGVQA